MLEKFGKRRWDGRDVQRDIQCHRMALLRFAANSIVKHLVAYTKTSARLVPGSAD